MTDTRIRSVVIVGGGTAGWMAACALANRLKSSTTKITLIESADIGTIGVGEATVPYLKEFLRDLKIDEADFVKKTSATYKLGIDFDGWHKPGERFLHPFAGYGSRIARIPFHHFWLKLKQQGKAKELDTYSLACQMARHNKFALPKANNDIELSTFNYAFHFDAALFARYLRQIAQTLGVSRIESTVTKVTQCPDSGFIQSLELQSGETISGELFIDCSGFKGLLIEATLNTGYEDWQHWLPCDRAVAMPCESTSSPASYTRSLATATGWQWRIPLQHRTGNGYVYASNYLSDDEAIMQLRGNLEGEAIAEPKIIPFVTGMRKKSWNKNVFSIGLASGFLEPLESTSIYMVQSSLEIFINHFPNNKFDMALSDRVNELLRARQERLRDFLILHYSANQRHGERFWDHCRHMALPESLVRRVNIFKNTAQIALDELDFFRTNSWLAMFAGFDIKSSYYHPFVDDFNEDALEQELRNIATGIQTAIAGLPSHADFIRKNSATENFAFG
jgi:tryptophan halogenase